MRIDEDAETALLRPSDGEFSEDEMSGLAGPIQRFLHASIAPESRLAQTARIEMTGHIKVGRWLPFRAREILTPHAGFVWAARAAGLITGSDRFVDGRGRMKWKLGGLITVMAADGSDVSRSAAQRAGAESVLVPTSLLPRFGVDWVATTGKQITAGFLVEDHPVEVSFVLNDESLAESVLLQRWGDPDNTGVFGLHPFGGHFLEHGTFNGLTIPTAGSMGWHYGTDRWSDGEFFRFRIKRLEVLPQSGAGSAV